MPCHADILKSILLAADVSIDTIAPLAFHHTISKPDTNNIVTWTLICHDKSILYVHSGPQIFEAVSSSGPDLNALLGIYEDEV